MAHMEVNSQGFANHHHRISFVSASWDYSLRSPPVKIDDATRYRTSTYDKLSPSAGFGYSERSILQPRPRPCSDQRSYGHLTCTSADNSHLETLNGQTRSLFTDSSSFR